MTQIKLTKTELRSEQLKLGRLQTYLPTLQLKKAMLQVEVSTAQVEIEEIARQFAVLVERTEAFARLLSDRRSGDVFASIEVENVVVKMENIAGLDIPVYEKVIFAEYSYPLFDASVWAPSAIEALRLLIEMRERLKVARQKKELLEAELRAVSIRVNLFEKIMIPRITDNIKRIKIFLSDQQLASIAQAKVAKQKIAEGALR